MRDLYAKLATAGITFPEQTKCLIMLSLLPESWLQFMSGLSLPQYESLWTLEWVRTKILEEDFHCCQLRGGDNGSSGYGMQGSPHGRGRSFGGAGHDAKKEDDSNDQQGSTGWGCSGKSGRGGRSAARPQRLPKLGASAIWCVHLGLAAERKGWLLWEPYKCVLFDSRDMTSVEGMMYGIWEKQSEAKVSQKMEQITMQLDLTPSVCEEGEEASAEGGDGEKVQRAPAGGGDGADVAEQSLGNEEAMLILPHGYDLDEKDEPAYCFLAPAPEEPASMEEALAGPDRDNWLASKDNEYQSQLENGTWDLVVLPEGEKVVQCKVYKSIYQKLAAVLEDMGFKTSSCDESLFVKGGKEKLVMFLVYVDDILLFSSSMKEILNVQQQLMENFKCKILGDARGEGSGSQVVEVEPREVHHVAGEKYGIEKERKVATPLLAEFKLVKAAEDEGVEAKEQHHFQSLVGSLLYAAVHTRPDISFSVGQLARVVQNPLEFNTPHLHR
ncbi:unnamed protein product [Closterium sp. NIES-53]